MENSSLLHDTHTPSLTLSPNSHSSNTSSTTSSTINGLCHRLSPPTPHIPSIPITRSDPNYPYPTTFVQADTSSFKQVVQMLTGSAESAARPEPVRNPIPPMKTGPRKDKSSSKLYERRNSLKNFKISPLAPGLVNTRQGFLSGYTGSPRPSTPEILSPSILDFPSLALSPVTPLIPDPFIRGSNSKSNLNTTAEDKAIKEKGFYFHPSPANTPRDSEPRLLPLFPVTSPRIACSSTAADS